MGNNAASQASQDIPCCVLERKQEHDNICLLAGSEAERETKKKIVAPERIFSKVAPVVSFRCFREGGISATARIVLTLESRAEYGADGTGPVVGRLVLPVFEFRNFQLRNEY